MKRYTSAALLALRLTWKIALAALLGGALVQTYFVYRWLMPGGVPLQAASSFETLLQSAAQTPGMIAIPVMMLLVGAAAGRTKGSQTIYTTNRLGISEFQMMVIFSLVFTGYFLLYWAVQIAACYGWFVWFSRFSLVSSNAWMLSCWRSEWLHTLIPLAEWWGYLRNLAICLAFGFGAELVCFKLRRGRHFLTFLTTPVFCMMLLDGRPGNPWADGLLTVLMLICVAAFCYQMKGGVDDEDL